MNDLKILAEQYATQAPGQNFYITKQGIKRDFNLFGKYEYKIYYKEGIYVEDEKGNIIKSPVSQELRNATDEEVNKRSDEQKRPKRSAN